MYQTRGYSPFAVPARWVVQESDTVDAAAVVAAMWQARGVVSVSVSRVM